MDNQQQQPFVKNAASKKQVDSAEAKERRQRDGELQDLRVVMSTGEGRRFMWRLMAKCRAFTSIHENSAKIHYNSGQQDLGFFLLNEIDEADPEMFFKMRNENIKKRGI